MSANNDTVAIEAGRMSEVEQLATWLHRTPPIGRSLVRPSLPDRGQRHRGVDAVVLDEEGVLHLVDVWWAHDLPRRDEADGRLYRRFESHPVCYPDPAVRLEQFRDLLVDRDVCAERITFDIVAPHLRAADAPHCRGVWAALEISLTVGAWPEQLGVPMGLRPAATHDAARAAFAYLDRDPHAVHTSAPFQAAFGQLGDDLLSMMRRNDEAPDTIEQIAESWQSGDREPLRVALLGTFSSGKTCLLNGFTAAPYVFPVKDIPTTAQQVEVGYGPRFRCEVVYHASEKMGALARRARRGLLELPDGVTARDLDPRSPRCGTRVSVGDWDRLSVLIQDAAQAVYIESIEVELPVEALRDLTVIDLPGTDSTTRMHREVTELALPSIDVGIYVFNSCAMFKEKDRELLDIVALQRNLTDATRFVFCANKYDRLDAAGREGVIARAEHELSSRFGIGRPTIVPTCLLLADACNRVQLDTIDSVDQEEIKWEVEDALSNLGLGEDLPPESWLQHSGFSQLRAFISSVVAEKSLWKAKSRIETAAARARDVLRSARLEAAAIERSAEEVAGVRARLADEVESARLSFEQAAARARSEVKTTLNDVLDPGKLMAVWHRAVGGFNGDQSLFDRRVQAETKAWLGGRSEQLVECLDAFQTQTAARAQTIVLAIQSAATESLTEMEESQELILDLRPTLPAGLGIDWNELDSTPYVVKFGRDIADELFRAADGIAIKGNFLERAVAVAGSAAAGIMGVTVSVLSGIADLAYQAWDQLANLFGGGGRSRTAKARTKLRKALSRAKAEEVTEPLRREINERTTMCVASVEALFERQLERIVGRLAETEQRLRQDPESLAERRVALGALSVAAIDVERSARTLLESL